MTTTIFLLWSTGRWGRGEDGARPVKARGRFRFVPGLALLVGGQPLGHVFLQIGIVARERQRGPRPARRFLEVPGLGVRRGERVEVGGVLVVRRLAGFLRQPERLRAVALFRLGSRGKRPGQVVLRLHEIRVKFQRAAIMDRGLGRASLAGECQSQVGLGPRTLWKQPQAQPQMPDCLVRLPVLA